MASTTAMFTALTGMVASARNLDVIGNNIANVNTTAFKSSRMLFSTQFARTLSAGTPPSANSGGTNPAQIGLGVQIAGIQRDFSNGSVTATGDPRDLAIDGNGFFIVQQGDRQAYTRAGAFRQNYNNDLVNVLGDRVQGFGVDANFNIIPGTLTNLNIPVGSLTLAEQTQNVRLAGNLNAGGSLPTQGSLDTLNALTLLAGATPPPGPGNVLETGSRLIDIADPANPTQPLFSAGQTLELNGAKRGTTEIPTARLTITSTTTVQDMMSFLATNLQINTSSGNNPDGQTPGVTLDPTTGVMSIVGNTGTVNNLDIESSDLQIVSPSSATPVRPFTVSDVAQANGESVRTTFVAFDSLGNQVSVNLTMVLDQKVTNGGTVWRYYADSPDNLGGTPVVGTGTVSFNSTGALTSGSSIPLSLDRTGTGAVSPMDFDLVLASTTDSVKALADQDSQIAAVSQDGAPLGVLAGFSVGADGIITGGFTNGLTRTLGQVAIATFANTEGLVDIGNSLFATGPSSGAAQVSAAQSLGAGKIVGGSLELSNVDLSQEFINMILASTGYSAASRVITTTDQLMQQLLVLGR